MPPCRRLETRGLPSLSMPPETVRPRVVPSFFISSTMLEPLNSSVGEREGGEEEEEEQRHEISGEQEHRSLVAAISLFHTHPHSDSPSCQYTHTHTLTNVTSN